MNIHVLSGSSLEVPFGETQIEGEVFTCRECLVDGDVQAESLEEFWSTRESFLNENYPKEDGFYEEKVKNEFIRLWNSSEGNSVNLWFEYELFCQVNMWFTIWLLRNSKASFHIVYPKLKSDEDVWKGFAFLDADDLKASFDERITLNHDNVYLAVQLWEAFQSKDFEKLAELGKTPSNAFPKLNDVCDAAAHIGSRPKESLTKIIADGAEDFGSAFRVFNETEAVYGFGDLQVKRIYDEVVSGG